MTTVLFLVSLFALSGLVGSKIFEIKVRKIHFLSNIFTRGDQKIHNFVELGESKYSRYKKILNIFIFDFLPSYMYEMLVRMKDYVSKKYYSAGDEFRGRRMLRSNGSVSFFLEQLSEEKTNASENKI